MKLILDLKLGLLNGWVLLVFFYFVYGVMLLTFPRRVITRLYDRSGWTRTQRILSAASNYILLAWLLLVVWTPLTTDRAVLGSGLAVYALGLAGFAFALSSYRDAPRDQPATKGLYRFSRNPQQVSILAAFLGTSLAVGSWLAVLLLAMGAFAGHVRVLAEEGACVDQYGDAYRRYMEQVPRYFLLF